MTAHMNAVNCPRAVIFDLDNTVAESFQPPSPHVASRLHQLLKIMPVAIMSGASFERMAQDLLPALPHDADWNRLYLFTDTASQCFVSRNAKWENLYKHSFAQGERERILSLINDGLKETGIVEGEKIYGDQFLARDTQITFSAIGTYAPPEAKAVWDPAGSKRGKLIRFLETKLPRFSLLMGGRTAIDITRKGIDQAFGVMWFAKHFGVAPDEMLFVGDALGPGGNDAIVIPTGIQTIEVKGPHETAEVIDKVLAFCLR